MFVLLTVSLPIRTVSQCYGKQISAKCESQHLMRIVSATYLRSRDCVGGASDLPLLGGGNESLLTTCSRDNVSGPQCVGNSSCIFTAPWIYISADCGYSNYFSLQYQCVPGIVNSAVYHVQETVNPLTPTVVIWVQMVVVICVLLTVVNSSFPATG